jgi:hypothetical protein
MHEVGLPWEILQDFRLPQLLAIIECTIEVRSDDFSQILQVLE